MSNVISLESDHTNQGRAWSLVHAEDVYPLTWDDGERLLRLTSEVRAGAAEPQPFSFTPRHGRAGRTVTIFVSADVPLELLTTYEEHPPRQSHWFG